MNELSGPARKAASAATSSGRPTRCSGIREASAPWKSSVLWPSLPARRSIAGVAMGQGRDDVHDAVEVGGLRDVAWHGDRAGAGFPGRCFEFVLAPAGQVDAGAVIGKAPGDREPDTAGGPGDQGRLSVHGAHGTRPFEMAMSFARLGPRRTCGRFS
jgi:hypothetical protein